MTADTPADMPAGTSARLRWRRAHRAALDHLLRLVAESSLAGQLVLRGSMVMPAWVGAGAREPGDLDWIVPRPLIVPIDPLDPYPYVDDVAVVQQWPETADGAGAGAYEMWKQEEYDTRGVRAVRPPEGLRWITGPEPEPETAPPHRELLDLVRQRPVAAPGVVLDPDAARDDGTWTYSAYDTPGVRVTVPWRAEGLPPGEARMDFARDERLPQAPVCTAVPRGDGGPPAVVRTASRELSLAWKLLWLHTDASTEAGAQGKDLYDAVLLAETRGIRLSPRLLRTVFPPGVAAPTGAVVRSWSVDWESFRAGHPAVRGTAEEWLDRLCRALTSVTAP
ncbi:nucleotidyl transferase AbiEii/AbiGii toxin family protein [Streptomyces sp. NPDC049627]|uniref:nucleotidyl transferase AbiEii/AbiGii toxin family protein n=1 Tax=Streptomyces sp. NPDC049627 TaxID=3365595 RepID=UPI0037BDDEB6